MSDATDHSAVPEDEFLAAELALGVLTGAERASAQARVAREPAFAAMVAAWEARLSPWAAEIGEVAPPPHVWDKIAQALPPARAPRAGLWQSLSFWRALSFATGGLAAACAAGLIYFATLSAPAPLVAAIDGGGHHHFVATIDAGRATIAVVPAAYSADATRVPELWLIPADGKPRPLGLLRADRTVTITIPAALAPHATSSAVLAVSLEPPGGSPTGQPTGPVIASGKLTAL
jgi:anti-sigma-K factor RskA